MLVVASPGPTSAARAKDGPNQRTAANRPTATMAMTSSVLEFRSTSGNLGIEAEISVRTSREFIDASRSPMPSSARPVTHEGMVGALKWLGAVLLAAVIVAAAGLLGPRLAGTTEASTEFGQVAIRLSPTLTGGMEGYVPVADWGIRFEGPPVPES